MSEILGPINRYGLDLTWTVLVMAEGTDTGEMPSFEPSPSSEAKKRHISSDGSECLSGLLSFSVSVLTCQSYSGTSAELKFIVFPRM